MRLTIDMQLYPMQAENQDWLNVRFYLSMASDHVTPWMMPACDSMMINYAVVSY
jgi:hypothetical protein